MNGVTGPCDWPILGCGTVDDYGQPDGVDLDCRALDSLSDVARGAVEQAAVTHLWMWTGRRFGLCEVTLRPCRKDCVGSTWQGHRWRAPWLPILVAGEWLNVACGTCGSECDCDTVPSVALPGPVDSVVEVLVDGTPVDPAVYRVDNRRLLVRQDGGRWPVCNDLSAPTTEPGTWQVTYLRGLPVPQGGQLAAGLLACEMAKAVCGDSSCKLPQRVQSITREGVTTLLLDGFDGLESGQTGIWFVDSWIASQRSAPRRATVYSPDVRRPRATTWTSP